jgi:DNA-binding NtrC family response regulator
MKTESMSQENEPASGRLLVVDDEPNVARVLSTFFTREGWQVSSFQNPVEALNAAGETDVDVIISDLAMPEMTGTELLLALRERGCTAPLLVITAHGTVDSAVGAMKLGAFDYLSKPFELDKVKLCVQRAYLHRQLQRENEHLRQELKAQYEFGNLIGSSPKMLEVYSLIEKAAKSQATMLILGESGTGKELVARALHYNSARSNKRFVAVSCAALPSELLESELFGHEKGSFTGANWQRLGRFELADGGTLFLDEIGDIGLNVQTKLLRVLQEREVDRVGGSKPVKVDVRLISATNRDLQDAIEKGDFREDLYYRLRVVEIHLPPLRERKEDLPLLAKHFLDKFNKRDGRTMEGFAPEAMELMEDYDWPGNVRELENAVEHALVLAEESHRQITPALLPVSLRGQRKHGANGTAGKAAGMDRKGLPEALEDAERGLLLAALDETGWDLSAAAESLGISFQAIRAKVRKHNLSGDRRPARSV